MSWTAPLGRAMDRFTPWARDLERCEALRDNPPVLEPEAAGREPSDAEIEWICEQEEQRIADYYGGTGPDWEAACATSQVENEVARCEEAGRDGNWQGVMEAHEDAEWGRDVLAEMDREAGQ